MTRFKETYDREGNLLESVPIPYTKKELEQHMDISYKAYLLKPITLHGITIIPDDKTLNRLNNKIHAMRYRNDPAETTTWIGVEGPVELGLDELEEIGLAADDQWQPYFTAIPAIMAQIYGGTITTPEQIDAALAAVGA